MPLYEYINEAGDTVEVYFRKALGRAEKPKFITLDEGEAWHPTSPEEATLVLADEMSIPAYTPGKYGDNTGKYGINGFQDRGLGCSWSSFAERDRIAESRGLIPKDAFGKHFFKDMKERHTAKTSKIRHFREAIEAETKRNGGDKIRATETVRPAREVLANNPKYSWRSKAEVQATKAEMHAAMTEAHSA